MKPFLSIVKPTVKDPQLWLVIAAVVVGLLPSVWARYHLKDDQILIRQASANRVHDQAPLRRPLFDYVKNFAATQGRLAPLTDAMMWVRARVFGHQLYLIRLLRIVVAAGTAALLYCAARDGSRSPWLCALFAIWLVQAPAATDVWLALYCGEPYGMLLTGATLYCIRRSSRPTGSIFYDCVGVVCFLGACLAKESFVLMAPALLWCRRHAVLASDCDSPQRITRGTRVALFAYGGVGVLTLAGIAAVVLLADDGSYGRSSLHLDWRRWFVRLVDSEGILRALPANSAWFLPIVTLGIAMLLRLGKVTGFERKHVVFALLIVVPQILLYLTRDGFQPRYIFPMLIGFAWLNLVAFEGLRKNGMKPVFRFMAIILIAAWTLRCAQIQFAESRNLANATLGIARMVADVVQRTPDDGTIVVCSPDAMRADGIVHHLGMLGRPHAEVYMCHPQGSNGAVGGCFFGHTDVDVLDSRNVHAVIYLVPRRQVNLSLEPWYDPERFDNLSEYNEQLFFSLWKLRFVRGNGGIDYDLARR